MNSEAKKSSDSDELQPIHVASWNVAAVNNNPFEYWITHEDPAYYALMQGVQEFIESPTNDRPIFEIFTDEMFEELGVEMQNQKMSGSLELKKYWLNDYRQRRAIKEFLKDKAIGLKRLVSMPDRITNTIDLQDGSKCKRPTVINSYDGGSLDTIDSWWTQWKTYMFHTPVQISTGEMQSCQRPEIISSLIGPILRSKYPAITIEEQLISVPLQILCLAILDAIFIDMMNRVQPVQWELIRKELCDVLINRKAWRVCNILAQSYGDMDIIFIQEAAAFFVQQAEMQPILSERFLLLQPWDLDRKRAQNSLILVHRSRFDCTTTADITEQVLALVGGAFTAAGDLLAVTLRDLQGRPWLLASFHGDSNGLSTQPLMRALDKVARDVYPDHLLLVGLDANTSSAAADASFHSVESFSAFLSERQLVSLWGVTPSTSVRTAYSSRTFLQTQLNKAKPYSQRHSMSHQNLKDWILAYGPQTGRISGVARDNTGRREYVEGTVLPSVDFPSDHAIVRAAFHLHPAVAALHPAGGAQESVIEIAEEPVGPLGASGRTILVRQRSVFLNVLLGERSFLRQSTALRIDPAVQAAAISTEQPAKPRERERTLYDYWGIGDSSKVPAYVHGIDERAFDQVEFAHIPTQLGAVSALDGACETLDARLERFCEDQFVRFVSQPRTNDLDVKPLLTRKGQDRSLWIMFSPRPFSIGITKPWGFSLLAMMGVIYFLEAVLFTYSVLEFRNLKGRYFRFSANEHGSSDFVGVRNDVRLFDPPGLLYDGCSVLIKNRSTSSANGLSTVVTFDEQITINGWYYSNTDYNSSVTLKVELSNDAQSWREIGRPPWMLKDSIHTFVENSSGTKSVDIRPTWMWVIQRILCDIIISMGCFGIAMLGVWGSGRKGVLCLAGTYLLISFVSSVVVLFLNVEFSHIPQNEALIYWAISAFSFLTGLVLINERYVLECYPLLNSCMGASTLFERLYYFPNDFGMLTLIMPGMTTISPMLCALVFVTLRYLTSKWIFGDYIKEERVAFEAVWHDILESDVHIGVLSKLRDCALEIQCSLSKTYIRQRIINNPENKPACGHEDDPDDIDQALKLLSLQRAYKCFTHYRSHFITDLGQLFRQASCLDIFLKQKVQNLGARSNGFFQALQCDGIKERTFHSWNDSSKYQDRIEWTSLKPPHRALEKLLRCYEFDVSRLLDICRQTIFFESIQDILTCLENIRSDREVKILKLKQRLDVTYDAEHSGGFRNVILNICLDSEGSRRFGVDNHICELQLSLIATSRYQNPEQHERYVILRNCRNYPSFFIEIYKTLSPRNLSSLLCKKIHTTDVRLCRDRNVNAITPLQEVSTAQHSEILSADTARKEAQIDPENKQSDINYSPVHDFEEDSDSIKGHNEKEQTRRDASECTVQDLNSDKFIADERRKMLEARFRALARNPSRGRDRNGVLQDAVAHASFGSVWNTSYPFAAALCKPWLPCIIFIYAVYLIWDLFVAFSILDHNNVSQGYHFRFTALEFRGRPGARPDNEGYGVSEFGILKNGCADDSNQRSSAKTVANGSLTISFDSLTVMNGWWLKTSDRPISGDPTRFRLESTSDRVATASTKWKLVGASSFQWILSGVVIFEDSFHNLSHARNEIIYFDMSVPLIWAVSRIGKDVILLFMNVNLLLISLIGEQIHGRWIVVAGFALKLSLDLSSFAYYVINQTISGSFVFGLYSALDVCTILVFTFAEKGVRLFLLISGACYISILSIYYHILVHNQAGLLGSTMGIENPSFLAGILLLLVALSAQFARTESRLRAKRMIRQDIARYDNCWGVLMQDSLSYNTAESMFEYTQALVFKLPKVARQEGRHKVDSDFSSNVGLVLDIDQLFAQAAAVDIYLKRKVFSWGSSTNGFLPVCNSKPNCKPKFQRCNLFHSEKDVMSEAKWAKRKTMRRAVEKLHRSYCGDASLLLDCCRQSIYFEDMQSLFACLKKMNEDEAVEMVRVNNRLHSSYSATLSAGYRNVCLNLRLRTEDTQLLRVDTHVCEVQLLLIDFALVKTDEGHSRYVYWRNQCGA